MVDLVESGSPLVKYSRYPTYLASDEVAHTGELSDAIGGFQTKFVLAHSVDFYLRFQIWEEGLNAQRNRQ